MQSMIRHAAWALASALVVTAAGCGNSGLQATAVPGTGGPSTPGTPGGPPQGPISCPAGGDLTTAAAINPALLPSEATMFGWQKYMVSLGPRFDGSPAIKSWHDFLAKTLADAGLSVKREPIPIDWWLHRKWSLKLVQNGVETELPAASYYPYSGHTPEGGVVADLVDAGQGLPTDFLTTDVKGKIAVFNVDLLPLKMGVFYAGASYIHDPDSTLTPLTDFTRMAFSIISPQISEVQPEETKSLYYARQGGAVGAIVSLQASAENAAGQYTPFGGHPGSNFNVPTILVDRATGDLLKAKIASGAKARLELVVDEHKGDTTDDIIATLPGSNPDEYIIFNTHTDGTSASEENGAIGVLAMAQYFSALPKSCRKRTMVFVMTPGHFHDGIGGDTGRFITKHPEIISKTVASLTMEHLGQKEWLDDTAGFHPSGLIEPAVFFGSVAPAVQAIMKNSVIAEDLRRVIVSRPLGNATYFGVGANLNAAGVPNTAYITGPHALYSFADNQHLGKVDPARIAAEVRTFARVGTTLDATDTTTLCAGMTPSTSGAITICTTNP